MIVMIILTYFMNKLYDSIVVIDYFAGNWRNRGQVCFSPSEYGHTDHWYCFFLSAAVIWRLCAMS